MADASRSALFHRQFLDDLRYWIENDRAAALRTLNLVEAVLRDPFAGVGKPEPLRHQFAGCWSRRITREHRMVYRVTQTSIEFLLARYHYA
ncbi:MAG: Txe/YoeB family addiction module toxin [Betaproteobacteria bacterium]|nr:Txe/YoeB family addiction module toxin [Betaproteobacteria bacterium]